MNFRRDHRRAASALLLIGCAAFCQGCVSQVADSTPAGARGPVNTGAYPNLNVLPRLATDQFNNDTLQAHNEAVTAAITNQRAQGSDALLVASSAAADQARLRALGLARGQATLRAIESPGAAAPATQPAILPPAP